MSLEQIQASVDASDKVEFKARNKREMYDWLNQTLRDLHFRNLKRNGRGLVRRYVANNEGRIYVAGGRGLDRLDPKTATLHHCQEISKGAPSKQ